MSIRLHVSCAVLLAVLMSHTQVDAQELQWMTLPQTAAQEPVQIAVLPTKKPKSAVVLMLHGSCGTDSYQLGSFRYWAEFYGARGIATVVVDSYMGRGLDGTQVCAKSTAAGWLDKRADDVARAVDWVKTQAWADPDRVLVFGESQGARVGHDLMFLPARRYPLIAFYGRCSEDFLKTHAAISDFPTSLFILGGADSIAPPDRCERYLAEFKSKGGNAEAVTTFVIPSATHAFDFPGVSGTFQGARLAYSAAAVKAASAEVDSFLQKLGWLGQ